MDTYLTDNEKETQEDDRHYVSSLTDKDLGVDTNEDPCVETDEDPGVVTNEDPGVETNEDPGVETNEDPGVETNEDPGVETNEDPGVETNEDISLPERAQQTLTDGLGEDKVTEKIGDTPGFANEGVDGRSDKEGPFQNVGEGPVLLENLQVTGDAIGEPSADSCSAQTQESESKDDCVLPQELKETEVPNDAETPDVDVSSNDDVDVSAKVSVNDVPSPTQFHSDSGDRATPHKLKMKDQLEQGDCKRPKLVSVTSLECLDKVDGIAPPNSRSRSFCLLPSIKEGVEDDRGNAPACYSSASSSSSSLASPPARWSHHDTVQRVSSKPTLTSISEELVSKLGDPFLNSSLAKTEGDAKLSVDPLTKGPSEKFHLACMSQGNGDALSGMADEQRGAGPKRDSSGRTDKQSQNPAFFPGGEGFVDDDKCFDDWVIVDGANDHFRPMNGQDVVVGMCLGQDHGTEGEDNVTVTTTESGQEVWEDSDQPISPGATGSMETAGLTGNKACSDESPSVAPRMTPVAEPLRALSENLERLRTAPNDVLGVTDRLGNDAAILGREENGGVPRMPQQEDPRGEMVSSEAEKQDRVLPDVSVPHNEADAYMPDEKKRKTQKRKRVSGATKRGDEETHATEPVGLSNEKDHKSKTSGSKVKGSGSDSMVTDVGGDTASPRESHSAHTTSSGNPEKTEKDQKDKDNPKQRSEKEKERDPRDSSKRKRDQRERLKEESERKECLRNAVGDVRGRRLEQVGQKHWRELRGVDVKATCRLQSQLSENLDESLPPNLGPRPYDLEELSGMSHGAQGAGQDVESGNDPSKQPNRLGKRKSLWKPRPEGSSSSEQSCNAGQMDSQAADGHDSYQLTYPRLSESTSNEDQATTDEGAPGSAPSHTSSAHWELTASEGLTDSQHDGLKTAIRGPVVPPSLVKDTSYNHPSSFQSGEHDRIPLPGESLSFDDDSSGHLAVAQSSLPNSLDIPVTSNAEEDFSDTSALELSHAEDNVVVTSRASQQTEPSSDTYHSCGQSQGLLPLSTAGESQNEAMSTSPNAPSVVETSKCLQEQASTGEPHAPLRTLTHKENVIHEENEGSNSEDMLQAVGSANEPNGPVRSVKRIDIAAPAGGPNVDSAYVNLDDTPPRNEMTIDGLTSCMKYVPDNGHELIDNSETEYRLPQSMSQTLHDSETNCLHLSPASYRQALNNLQKEQESPGDVENTKKEELFKPEGIENVQQESQSEKSEIKNDSNAICWDETETSTQREENLDVSDVVNERPAAHHNEPEIFDMEMESCGSEQNSPDVEVDPTGCHGDSDAYVKERDDEKNDHVDEDVSQHSLEKLEIAHGDTVSTEDTPLQDRPETDVQTNLGGEEMSKECDENGVCKEDVFEGQICQEKEDKDKDTREERENTTMNEDDEEKLENLPMILRPESDERSESTRMTNSDGETNIDGGEGRIQLDEDLEKRGGMYLDDKELHLGNDGTRQPDEKTTATHEDDLEDEAQCCHDVETTDHVLGADGNEMKPHGNDEVVTFATRPHGSKESCETGDEELINKDGTLLDQMGIHPQGDEEAASKLEANLEDTEIAQQLDGRGEDNGILQGGAHKEPSLREAHEEEQINEVAFNPKGEDHQNSEKAPNFYHEESGDIRTYPLSYETELKAHEDHPKNEEFFDGNDDIKHQDERDEEISHGRKQNIPDVEHQTKSVEEKSDDMNGSDDDDVVSQTDERSHDMVQQFDEQSEDSIPQPNEISEEMVPQPDEKSEEMVPQPNEKSEEMVPQPNEKSEEMVPQPDEKSEDIVPHPDEKSEDIVSHPDKKSEDMIPEPDEKSKDMVPHFDEKSKDVTSQTDETLANTLAQPEKTSDEPKPHETAGNMESSPEEMAKSDKMMSQLDKESDDTVPQLETLDGMVQDIEEESSVMVSKLGEKLNDIIQHPEEKSGKMKAECTKESGKMTSQLDKESGDMVSQLEILLDEMVQELEEKSNNVISQFDEKSDDMVPHPDEKSDEMVPHPDETSDEMVPHPDETSDEMVPHPDEKSDEIVPHSYEKDEMVPHPYEKSDEMVPYPDEKDQMVPHPDETSDEMVPHPNEKDGMVPHPDETSDEMAPYPDEKSDEMVPHPDEKSDEMVQHRDEKSEDLMPHRDETSDEMVPYPDEKSDEMVPHPDEKDEMVPHPDEKSDEMVLYPNEKDEMVPHPDVKSDDMVSHPNEKDEMVPQPDEKSDEMVPHRDEKSEELMPHPDETLEEMVPHPDEKDEMVPHPDEKDEMVPHSDEKSDEIVPHPDEKDEMVPHPNEKDEMVPHPDEKDEMVPHLDEKSDEMVPHPDEKDEMVPHRDEKSDDMVPHPDEKSDEMVPHPDEKDEMVPHPDEKGEMVPHPDEKSDEMVPHPDEKSDEIMPHPDEKDEMVPHPDEKDEMVPHPDEKDEMVPHPDEEDEMVPHPDEKSDVMVPHPDDKSDDMVPHPDEKSDEMVPHPDEKDEMVPHPDEKDEMVPHPDEKSEDIVPQPIQKSGGMVPHHDEKSELSLDKEVKDAEISEKTDNLHVECENEGKVCPDNDRQSGGELEEDYVVEENQWTHTGEMSDGEYEAEIDGKERCEHVDLLANNETFGRESTPGAQSDETAEIRNEVIGLSSGVQKYFDYAHEWRIADGQREPRLDEMSVDPCLASDLQEISQFRAENTGDLLKEVLDCGAIAHRSEGTDEEYEQPDEQEENRSITLDEAWRKISGTDFHVDYTPWQDECGEENAAEGVVCHEERRRDSELMNTEMVREPVRELVSDVRTEAHEIADTYIPDLIRMRTDSGAENVYGEGAPDMLKEDGVCIYTSSCEVQLSSPPAERNSQSRIDVISATEPEDANSPRISIHILSANDGQAVPSDASNSPSSTPPIGEVLVVDVHHFGSSQALHEPSEEENDADKDAEKIPKELHPARDRPIDSSPSPSDIESSIDSTSDDTETTEIALDAADGSVVEDTERPAMVVSHVIEGPGFQLGHVIDNAVPPDEKPEEEPRSEANAALSRSGCGEYYQSPMARPKSAEETTPMDDAAGSGTIHPICTEQEIVVEMRAEDGQAREVGGVLVDVDSKKEHSILDITDDLDHEGHDKVRDVHEKLPDDGPGRGEVENPPDAKGVETPSDAKGDKTPSDAKGDKTPSDAKADKWDPTTPDAGSRISVETRSKTLPPKLSDGSMDDMGNLMPADEMLSRSCSDLDEAERRIYKAMETGPDEQTEPQSAKPRDTFRDSHVDATKKAKPGSSEVKGAKTTSSAIAVRSSLKKVQRKGSLWGKVKARLRPSATQGHPGQALEDQVCSYMDDGQGHSADKVSAVQSVETSKKDGDGACPVMDGVLEADGEAVTAWSQPPAAKRHRLRHKSNVRTSHARKLRKLRVLRLGAECMTPEKPLAMRRHVLNKKTWQIQETARRKPQKAKVKCEAPPDGEDGEVTPLEQAAASSTEACDGGAEMFEVSCELDWPNPRISQTLVRNETSPVQLLMQPLMTGLAADSKESPPKSPVKAKNARELINESSTVKTRPSKRMTCAIM